MLKMILFVALLGISTLGGCAGSGIRTDNDRHQADVYYKLAEAHLQGNNPSAALRELLKAVDLDPTSAAIRASLAQAYEQRRAYAQAETNYLEALKLSKNDPAYQNNLANLYLTMKEWDKAIFYFDLAAANLLFDSTQVALTGKGYALMQKGDYVSALQTFREVSSIAPNFAPAYFYQAEIFRLTDDSALEKVALRRTIDLAPDLIQARYRLAVLLLNENNPQQARRQLETIINFAPDSDEGRNAVELLKTLPKS